MSAKCTTHTVAFILYGCLHPLTKYAPCLQYYNIKECGYFSASSNTGSSVALCYILTHLASHLALNVHTLEVTFKDFPSETLGKHALVCVYVSHSRK